jgi:thiol-disulfide isomerase/thioredoxin
MNKNLLQRRQLLFYFGLGVLGIGAAKTAFSSFGKVNSPNPTVVNSNNTQPSKIIAVNSPAGKSLPEFQGISQWLNSPPLSTADLKGSVVLIQFWTFACINCQRTLPYITKWHQQYAAQGLKVVGIHTAEFAFERDANNIKKALQQHKITYPVPVDNEYKTWNAYDNQYWPHLFLADRQGLLRYDHIGEGAYDKTEQTIRQLLG